MSERFTPTQLCLLSVLSDGLAHTREELMGCMDGAASPSTLRVHLSLLRKKLRLVGQDVLVEFVSMRLHYRQVRLMSLPK